MHRAASRTGGAGADCCGCPAGQAWKTAGPDRRRKWCGLSQSRRCAPLPGSPWRQQDRSSRRNTVPAHRGCGPAASCSRCAAGPRPVHRTAWPCRCPPAQSSWPAAQRAGRPLSCWAEHAAAPSLRSPAAARRCGFRPAGGRQRPGPACTGPRWRPESRCGRRSRPENPGPPARCPGYSLPGQ